MEYNTHPGNLRVTLNGINMEIKWGLWDTDFVCLRLSEGSLTSYNKIMVENNT